MREKFTKLANFIVKSWWFVKCLFLFGGNIEEGSICWFSSTFFDIHDYSLSKGGDGFPSHFHWYTCPKCGKKFTI